MKNKIFYLLLVYGSISGLKIDRVILSSDTNQKYIQFWPMVATAWKEIIGVKPTLCLIADDTYEIDESYGDVIRFKPLPGLPTSYQAQIIRLLAPMYFQDDVCIISDIDMLPLSKEYFCDSIKDIADDTFVVYRSYASTHRYSMCYNAAQGKTFTEVFDLKSVDDIPQKMYQWWKLNYGWNTDEKVLTATIDAWGKLHPQRYINLGHKPSKRIDRSDWKFNEKLLKQNYYIDAHMPRPYSKFKTQIDKLLAYVMPGHKCSMELS